MNTDEARALLEILPNINFAEKDVSTIEQEVIARFEEKAGRKLYRGDPLRLLLLGFIKYIALQRSTIDFAGKQNLLRYSSEGYLQNLAALVGTTILEPSTAVTILKFTISAPFTGNIIIPKGTRATAGNQIYFATTEEAEIKAGEISVEVPAKCTQAGVIGNDYYPGQINLLSDPFPYACKVENTTMTQGGADREDLEAFRERTRTAPESYSSAGPYGAYEYWAKTASQLIVDVSVTSPSPGEVEIVPLLMDGDIPTQAWLDAVYDECNNDERRPLTDKVIVRAPEYVGYNISFKYYISRKDSAMGLSIQTKVIEAVDKFVLWQKSALGRDLNPSMLTGFLMETGIKRVEITKPEFTQLRHDQVAVAENINFIYGGLEDA